MKVFLYKTDHVKSCGAVHPDFNVPQLRGQFKKFGKLSLPWLKDECDLCQPKLVVTFGQEVAQVISDELNASADNLLSRAISYPEVLGGYPTLYVPHPDACRRSDKWRNQMKERVAVVREFLLHE